MAEAWARVLLYVVARRARDDAYLLTDGDVAYITYGHKPGARQGSIPVEGPFPASSIRERDWHYFAVRVPYHGPLRGLTPEELQRRDDR